MRDTVSCEGRQRTVKYALPQFIHVIFAKRRSGRVRKEDGEAFDGLVSRFLVFRRVIEELLSIRV